jgi:18S rRNA (guanine1575-N7)-methyltransferase
LNDDFHFEVKRKRPEEKYNTPLDYFKGDRLTQYAKSKSMMHIQERITIRALEILELENASLILDMGCGPGFTSVYLNEIGHHVIALDIIPEFLNFYDIRELNPVIADMCNIPFKPNSCDAIISISALQWVYRDINNANMRINLINLAKSISHILKPNSKAVFQFYPKSDKILKEVGKIITNNTNLEGNFIIDNPTNLKKREIFLLLENS